MRAMLVMALVSGCGRVGFGAISDASEDAGDVVADAPDPVQSGCSDGTNDGYRSPNPSRIVGCQGGWAIAGIRTGAVVACVATGNSSTNPDGTGCAAANLCAQGWHICADPQEVGLHITDAASCSALVDDGGFYATQTHSQGVGTCESIGSNDIFGCGVGSTVNPSCEPLDASSNNDCTALSSDWDCGTDVFNEAEFVTKAGGGGGVLCCKG
jgi:hypothetical protein